MHVVAARPSFLDEASAPEGALEKEKNLLLDQARESGKDPKILGKMVEGRCALYFCMYSSVYVCVRCVCVCLCVLGNSLSRCTAPASLFPPTRPRSGFLRGAQFTIFDSLRRGSVVKMTPHTHSLCRRAAWGYIEDGPEYIFFMPLLSVASIVGRRCSPCTVPRQVNALVKGVLHATLWRRECASCPPPPPSPLHRGPAFRRVSLL